MCVCVRPGRGVGRRPSLVPREGERGEDTQVASQTDWVIGFFAASFFLSALAVAHPPPANPHQCSAGWRRNDLSGAAAPRDPGPRQLGQPPALPPEGLARWDKDKPGLDYLTAGKQSRLHGRTAGAAFAWPWTGATGGERRRGPGNDDGWGAVPMYAMAGVGFWVYCKSAH